VVIEVEPEVELQLVPDQLALRAAPGDRPTVALTLVNAGNVPAAVRRTHAVGLFATGGVERALHRTYVELRGGPAGKGDDAGGEGGPRARAARPAERPVDRLFELLGEEHGGLLRLTVEEGAGDVAPGERRELRVTLAVPDDLRRGRTYTGTWALHDLRYHVRLVVEDGEAGRDDPPG
jgi:hypothetical protein